MLKYKSLLAVLCLIVCAGCSDDDTKPAPSNDRDAAIDATADTGPATDADGDAADTADAPSGPPTILVEPTQLFFEGVEIGESKTASVSVSNVGESTLYITNLELTEREPGDTAELKPGTNWLEGDNMAIEPGTFETIDVLYEPVNEAVDPGFLTISDTDPDKPQVVVPIETISSYPDIDVPKTLRFGTVAVGESATEEVVIYNRGMSPLTVNDITMGPGSAAFSMQMQSPYETPAVIDQDDYIVFEITYDPSDADTDTTTVTIDSNDPDEGSFEIGVVGNEPTPCIRVSADSLDFGQVPTGQRQTKSLTVLNCSQTRQLEVSQISLSTDGGGAFSINQAPQTPVDIPPTTTETVQVAASSDDARDAAGILVIESDDPQQGGLVVDLRAAFVAP